MAAKKGGLGKGLDALFLENSTRSLPEKLSFVFFSAPNNLPNNPIVTSPFL